MSLLAANNLAKEFGADEIFSGINIEIHRDARIALVGPNGAGKTTLLSLLLGMDTPTGGTISRTRGVRIGFLPQRPELEGDHTLLEEMMSAFDGLREIERELTDLEHQIATVADNQALLTHYGELQEKFADAGGYTYESRLKMVMQGLSFTPEDGARPLALLSGGQKTRAFLGRLLLEQPDLLMLDEPTNHLDIDAVEWLEGFLRDFPGAVLVVSHDRYFMDAVASNIWELDFGTLDTYRGNYSHYVRQRGERHDRLLKEYEAQQEFIAKETDYIRRNLAGQNTKQAKGRRTRLERLKKEGGMINKPRTRENLHLRLGKTVRSGDKVLMTRKLEVGYADSPTPLFQSPDITLLRGEVAALIGANGAGKSTFVKTVIEQIDPFAGEVVLGAAVKVGYFAQAHELLDPRNTLIDEILSAKEMPISQARDFLAKFLFTGDDAFRTIDTLSGGERGRVALAKLSLTGANLLLLDEPTNHLDIPSQEILQNVLAEFPGTILLVSHDRYLIDALATQIWSLSVGKLEVFEGSYQEFLAKRALERQALAASREQSRETARVTTGANGKNISTKEARQLQQRINELEARIPQLETELESITAQISDASAKGNAILVRELGEKYAELEAQLTKTMADWEQLIQE